MEIRLDQIGSSPLTWRESLDLDASDFDIGADAELSIGPVDCRGSLDPTSQGFVLRIRLHYQQTLACVRCLEPWTEEVESEVGLLLTLAEDQEEPAEELNREDLGILALEEAHFDTRPLVVEHIQLSLPMKPLCRPDCAGLCSRCGADLNQGPCDCEPDVDPRWAGLAALRGGAGQ